MYKRRAADEQRLVVYGRRAAGDQLLASRIYRRREAEDQLMCVAAIYRGHTVHVYAPLHTLLTCTWSYTVCANSMHCMCIHVHYA